MQSLTTQAPALRAPGRGPHPLLFPTQRGWRRNCRAYAFYAVLAFRPLFPHAVPFLPPSSPWRLTLRQHRQPHPLSLRNHHGGWGKFAGAGDPGHPIRCHPLTESGRSAPGEFQTQTESRSGVRRPCRRGAGFLGPGGELRLGLGGQRWGVLGWRRKEVTGLHRPGL